jgi:transcriptional regulator with XRE-family HTH domain
MDENTERHWLLRELAVSARVSVAALLQEAGVSTSAVHQWKTGRSKPRSNTIAKLNQAAQRLREREP